MISAELGKQLEAYIQQLVDAGRYGSKSRACSVPGQPCVQLRYRRGDCDRRRLHPVVTSACHEHTANLVHRITRRPRGPGRGLMTRRPGPLQPAR